MKKTLADLKRDAKSGKMYLQLFSRYGKTAEEIPERLQGLRPVVDCNTVAIFLQNRNGEKSEMRLGAASLTDYTGETLTIYNPGKREPNAEEAATLAAAAAARKEYQEKNPYSESYYFMKDYYKKSAFPYLDGFTTAKGKRYTNGLIIDNSIKGEKILVYNVIFAESIEEAEQKAQERTQDAPKTPETIKAGENTTDGEKPQEEQKNNYKYGMKYRGFSIGAQPAGVIAREDDPTGKYYDIIIYNKPLTPDQIKDYELQPITQNQPSGDSEKLPEESNQDTTTGAQEDTTSPAESREKPRRTNTPRTTTRPTTGTRDGKKATRRRRKKL